MGIFTKKVRLPELLLISQEGPGILQDVYSTALRAIGKSLAESACKVDGKPTSERQTAFDTILAYEVHADNGPISMIFHINADTSQHFVAIRFEATKKSVPSAKTVDSLQRALKSAELATVDSGRQVLTRIV